MFLASRSRDHDKGQYILFNKLFPENPHRNLTLWMGKKQKINTLKKFRCGGGARL